jgi:hypothetical protein
MVRERERERERLIKECCQFYDLKEVVIYSHVQWLLSYLGTAGAVSVQGLVLEVRTTHENLFNVFFDEAISEEPQV